MSPLGHNPAPVFLQLRSRALPCGPSRLLADDADLAALADRLKLSGGNIRNIALAAAFFGAADGGKVRNQHILRALQREYQKWARPSPTPNSGTYSPPEGPAL